MEKHSASIAAFRISSAISLFTIFRVFFLIYFQIFQCFNFVRIQPNLTNSSGTSAQHLNFLLLCFLISCKQQQQQQQQQKNLTELERKTIPPFLIKWHFQEMLTSLAKLRSYMNHNSSERRNNFVLRIGGVMPHFWLFSVQSSCSYTLTIS